MKKMVLVLTLAAFALSGSAFAQDPNYFDNIGIYMTPGGYVDPAAPGGSCGVIGDYNTPFMVHVVLSRLTSPEVWQWEARILPDNMLVADTYQYGLAVDAGVKENEYIVGLALPLPAVDNAVLVMDMTCMILQYTHDLAFPSTMAIEGVYFSTIDPINGPPSYLVNAGGPVLELHPALDGPFQLILNGDCDVVAVEDSSFGSVKSLYR